MPRDKELKVITGQAGRKDKNAEKKLMDDTINGANYKKWNKKFVDKKRNC